MNNIHPSKKFNSRYQSLIKFTIKASFLFLAWFLADSFNFFTAMGINSILIQNLLQLSSKILDSIGYEIFINKDIIGIVGTSGVLIGIPCNGFDLMLLFSFILVILDGYIPYKLVYIFLGLLLIHFLNMLRIIALILIVKYAPESLEFNHSYTFTIIMYAIIFYSWIFWVKKFSNARNE